MVEVNKLICCFLIGISQIESLNGLYAITISTAKLHFPAHIHKFCLEKLLSHIDFLSN